MCCLGDTPEIAACRQPGSDCPHPFTIVACLSLLCIALIKTLTKCNLERNKGSFHLSAYKSITEGSQVRNMEARTKAEAMEEDSLELAPHGLLNCFLIPLRHSPEVAPAPSGLSQG